MERIERITPNGHRVVVFNPRRYCKRTLFNRVVKELKYKPINWFKFVLLEMKSKFRNRGDLKSQYIGTSFEPKYDGKMYDYKWVFPTHTRLKEYYKNQDGKGIWYLSNNVFTQLLKKGNAEMAYLMDKHYSYTKWREVDDKRLKEIINEIWYKGLEKLLSESYTKRIPNLTMYKIRVKIGTMDLSKSVMDYYSVLNLKRWDKKTKKTSNKGLKADTTYSWSDGYGRGGWTFGGLQAGALQRICIQNGFKDKKGCQYGDYAEWYLNL